MPGFRNWLYLIDMFAVIEDFNQTIGLEEIKLGLIRFIAEFLIQTAHFSVNYLDDLIDTKFTDSRHVTFDTGAEFSTYGSQLLIEFAKVFKVLYVGGGDKSAYRGDPNSSATENSQKDICLCLNVLFSSCQSAKTVAIEQNFLKKAIDICSENTSAIHLMALQKYSSAPSGDKMAHQRDRALKQQQMVRKLKHVEDLTDVGLCERQAVRMLGLVRHLFYDSKELLGHVFLGQGEAAEKSMRS